jgi:hypothetical protein
MEKIMSSLIKLPTRYTFIQGAKEISPTSDNMGARLRGTGILLSGEDAGKQVTEIKLNQLVKISPIGKINAGKYTIFVGFNPALAELGAVSCPAFCGNGSEVSLVIKAYKNFSLSDLDYIFNIYLID